jgi:hypothetical protein
MVPVTTLILFTLFNTAVSIASTTHSKITVNTLKMCYMTKLVRSCRLGDEEPNMVSECVLPHVLFQLGGLFGMK